MARKLAQDLERRNVFPPNQGGYRAGRNTWENAARFAYDAYEGFQRKEQTLAAAFDLEDADNRVHFKLLMELLVQYGVSLTRTRWLAAALQEKKGCHATWKLDLHAPTTDNGTSIRLPPPPLPTPPVPSPLQCLDKGTGGCEQQWFKPGAYACGRRAYLQNSQLHPYSSHRCPGAAGKSVTLVPRDRVRNQSKQGASSVVHPQQQSRRTSNANSLLQWRSYRTHEQS